MLILIGFFCIFGVTSAAVVKITPDKVCVNRTYEPAYSWYGSHYRCCSNELLTPGISGHMVGLSTDWKTPPKDDQENITISAWRAYTTVLRQKVHLDKNTITFPNFTQAMIDHYPDNIKASIAAAANKAYDEAVTEKVKNLLTSPVSITDFEKLNRIRATYFGIEQSVCKGKKFEPNPDIKMWNDCSTDPGAEIGDGRCCRNNTIPFSDLFRNTYRLFRCQKCNVTLEKLLQKLKLIKDPKDERILTLQMTCRVSCFLIDNKVITPESLIGVKETDTFLIDDIVEILTPAFYSKSVHRFVKDFVKKHFDLKIVKKLFVTPSKNPLEGKVKKEDLLGCYGHDGIKQLVMHALEQYCNPENGGVITSYGESIFDLRLWKQ